MNGVERIAAERKRQIEIEGWDARHDSAHGYGELADAAACYASSEPIFMMSGSSGQILFSDPWPWGSEWDKRKKHDRLRRLEIAGALIAAEIDRILATQIGDLPCPVCGNEERGQGGYLTCECPADKRSQ